MVKLFIQTISRCHECPNIGWDQNISRCECRAKDYTFVGMITMEMMRMKSHILLFLIGVLYQTAKYHRSEV
jgi:hypothetical protein